MCIRSVPREFNNFNVPVYSGNLTQILFSLDDRKAIPSSDVVTRSVIQEKDTRSYPIKENLVATFKRTLEAWADYTEKTDSRSLLGRCCLDGDVLPPDAPQIPNSLKQFIKHVVDKENKINPPLRQNRWVLERVDATDPAIIELLRIMDIHINGSDIDPVIEEEKPSATHLETVGQMEELSTSSDRTDGEKEQDPFLLKEHMFALDQAMTEPAQLVDEGSEKADALQKAIEGLECDTATDTGVEEEGD